MLVPINLTGGDYRHKSHLLSSQLTRNFWPQAQQRNPKAKSPYILQSFYGLSEFADPDIPGVCRGQKYNQGVLYRVVGESLYSIASDGTHTSLGTIPGEARCIISALGSSIIVVNGAGLVYIWNGTTLTQNTDVNLGTPNGVAVLNNQAIYDAGTGQGFDVSDVGDPATISGLNNAQAESASDELVLPYAYRETLYLMGGDTTELWWNSGQGNPPFDKIQGAVIQVGLDARYSVADDEDFIYFLGSDKQFHALTAGASAVDEVISTPEMSKEIQNYATTSDCIGWTMKLEGQKFYVATFPTQNITWVLPIGGEWFQWGSGSSGRIRANSYSNAYGKHLVGDYTTAKMYELKAEVYTDASDEIIRKRISAPIHGGLFKQDGKAFEINSIELMVQVGQGLLTGQGSDPVIGISVSRDGGQTFGTERFLRVGKRGELVKVVTGSFGRFESQCVVKLQTSDPVYWAIHSAAAEIEVCI